MQRVFAVTGAIHGSIVFATSKKKLQVSLDLSIQKKKY